MTTDQSYAAIAQACGWLNEKGEPQKMRVLRAIGRLEKAKPLLIKEKS